MGNTLNKLRRFIQKDLAMDLGTANTLIYVPGEGIILNEPTVIVLSDEGKEIEIGHNAKKYLGKTPKGMKAIRPMKDGVISDFNAMTLLIKSFLRSAKALKGLLSPLTIICVPSDATQIEKRAVLDAAYSVGLKKVHLLEEVMAAAIGIGLDVSQEGPFMVADIGGGTSEVAVISKNGYISNKTARIAGDEMDEAVIRWFIENKGIMIGQNTAEQVKIEIGSIISNEEWDSLSYNVSGLDLKSGMPKTMTVNAYELREAFKSTVETIKEVFEEILVNLPQNIREKIEKNGIYLTGGGSLLRGLNYYLEDQLQIKVHRANDPLLTVVMGAGKILDDLNNYRSIFIN